jgi:hypothetical protein
VATVEYRYGALAVVETAQDYQFIDHALKQLDPRLFLERQLTFDNEFMWTVQLDVPDQPPVWILDWEDADGRPINAPTFGIVDRVKDSMKRGPVDNEEHRRRNDALRERRKRQHQEEVAELAREHIKAHVSKGYPMFPRERPENHGRHRRREQRLRASDLLVRG